MDSDGMELMSGCAMNMGHTMAYPQMAMKHSGHDDKPWDFEVPSVQTNPILLACAMVMSSQSV